MRRYVQNELDSTGKKKKGSFHFSVPNPLLGAGDSEIRSHLYHQIAPVQMRGRMVRNYHDDEEIQGFSRHLGNPREGHPTQTEAERNQETHSPKSCPSTELGKMNKN